MSARETRGTHGRRRPAATGAAVLFVTALCAWGAAAAAADFDAGMRAANMRDYATALREWRPLAEQDDMRAQYYLGMLYEEGRGVPRDPGAAASWYRRAAAQGHAQAQNALGILYVQGSGVGRDPVAAYKWFALAARNGDGFAGRNLAKLAGMLSAEEIARGEQSIRDHVSGNGR
ncbi:MAG: tetratricopeptide repeat protein [Kiloniellaceae bacterium]